MKEVHLSESNFLLSAIQRGDQKAFDALFRRYYPALCAYGHRFVDLEDAEEIVQDSLLWIWENRENLFIETRFYEEMQEMLQDTDLYQVEELTQRIKDAIATLPES